MGTDVDPGAGSVKQTDAQRILQGGAIAGVLDATDGVVAFGLVLGMNPIQPQHSVED